MLRIAQAAMMVLAGTGRRQTATACSKVSKTLTSDGIKRLVTQDTDYTL